MDYYETPFGTWLSESEAIDVAHKWSQDHSHTYVSNSDSINLKNDDQLRDFLDVFVYQEAYAAMTGSDIHDNIIGYMDDYDFWDYPEYDRELY
jgi:hypothetical protein